MKTLKQLILSAFLILNVLSISAQGEASLPTGGKQLNFGLPGYVGLDFGLSNLFTLGPKVSLGIFDNSSSFKFGVVADFHLNTIAGIPSNWDAYVGLSAGWLMYNNSSKNDGLNLGGQIGGRYFWSDKWGANLEFGFSGSVGGGIGLTMRM